MNSDDNNKMNIFDFQQEDEFLTQKRERHKFNQTEKEKQNRTYSINENTIKNIDFFEKNNNFILQNRNQSFKVSEFPIKNQENINILQEIKESVIVKKLTSKKSEEFLEKNEKKDFEQKNNTIIFPIEEVDSRMKSQTLNIMKKMTIFQNNSINNNIMKISDIDPLDFINKETLILSNINIPKEDIENTHLIYPKYSKSERKPCFLLNYLSESSEIKFGNLGHGEKPSSFCISERYLILGISSGFIIIYDFQNKKKRIIQHPNENYHNISINCLDISYDEELLTIGYNEGTISFYDMNSFKLLKFFNNIHASPLLTLRFFHDSNKSLKESHLITTDSANKSFKLCFKKGIIGYDIEYQLLMNDPLQIYQNEVLFTDYFKNSKNKDCKILALVSFQKIIIIQIEPKPKRICTFNRPETLTEFCANVSWNHKIGNNYLNPPILAISWGDIIILIEISENKDNEITGKIIKYIVIDYITVFIGFLNIDCLCVAGQNKFDLLIKDEFLDFEENWFNEGNFEDDFLKKIINKSLFPLNNGVEFKYKPYSHKMIKDLNNLQIECSQISFLNRSMFFFLYEDVNISQIRLKNWNNYLLEIKEKENFQDFLCEIIEIYKGNRLRFSDLPPNLIQRNEIIHQFIIKSIDDFLKENISKFKNEENYNLIINIIEFLLETNESKYLFCSVFEYFTENNLKENFLECLEPFIRLKKLNFLPNECFRSIITYYKSKGNLDLIEKLIFSLDYKLTDTCPLITLCLEFQFFTALIYICTIFTQDFITPLIKMISVYENNKDKTIGYRCLWLIREIFKGKLINGELIEIDILEKNLEQIIIWIFEPENLYNLMNIDIKIFFEISFLLFHGNNNIIIEKFNEKIILKINYESEDLNEIIKSDFVFSNKIILFLIRTHNKLVLNQPEAQIWLDLFILKLINEEKFTINTEIVEKSFINLLENPIFLNDLPPPTEFIDNYTIEIEEIVKSDYLIKMFNYFYSKIKNNSIYTMQELNQFCKLNLFINTKIQNYQKCFEIFVNTKNKIFKNEIHDWLYENLKRSRSKKEELKKLNDLILLHLPHLANLNIEKTHEIISIFNKQAEKTVIKYLASFPNLQKSYLERLLLKRQQGETIDDELLLLQIELLCKLNEDENLLNNLKNWEYPLDGSLKLCRKYNKLQAIAYLLERTGAIEEAMEIYFKLIFNSFINCISSFELNAKNVSFINNIIDSIVFMSKKNDLYGFEGYWFKFLDFLINIDIKLIQTIDDLYEFKTILKEFYKILFGNIFTEMAQNITIDILIKEIKEKYGFLSLGYLKKSFIELFDNYLYEKNIFANAKALVMNEICNKDRIYYEKNKGGFYMKNICLKCDLEIKNNQIRISFFCGHYLHMSCMFGNRCPICENKPNIIIERLCSQKISEKSNENEDIKLDFSEKKENTLFVVQDTNTKIIKANLRKKKTTMLNIFEINREDELLSIENITKKYDDF